MMRTHLILATVVAVGLVLQGCETVPYDSYGRPVPPNDAYRGGAAVGNLLGNAAGGATIGALIGAGVSPKGGGRRSDGAVRGALIGAGAGLLFGGSRYPSPGYGYPRDGATTNCRSVLRRDAYGRVYEDSEHCYSNVRRYGYRNW